MLGVVPATSCGEIVVISLSPLKNSYPGLQHNLDAVVFLMFVDIV
jgi:hypothetical protein